jgi:hypothetical protein
MAEPGAAGDWAIKDIIVHLTHHERWLADRLHEHLRGESYVPTEADTLPFDEANDRVFQQNRHRAAADVLADSRATFQRLVDGLEAHPEEFLIEPQQFEGVPQPVVIWTLLRGSIYEHYALHMPSIRAWLAAHQTD